MTTPSDTLRAAAARIREVALAATPGPWTDLDNGDRIVHFPSEDRPHEYVVDEPLIANPANGAHIALWHPLVAEAVAEWLVNVGDSMSDEAAYEHEYPERVNCRVEVEGYRPGHSNRPAEWTAALAAARAILGQVAP